MRRLIRSCGKCTGDAYVVIRAPSMNWFWNFQLCCFECFNVANWPWYGSRMLVEEGGCYVWEVPPLFAEKARHYDYTIHSQQGDTPDPSDPICDYGYDPHLHGYSSEACCYDQHDTSCSVVDRCWCVTYCCD